MNGFIGQHLARRLRADGWEVWALDRGALRGELPTDSPAPDVVFHLAGVDGRANEAQLRTVNVEGTRNLLDALVALGCKAKTVLLGSSAAYGEQGSDGTALRESFPPQPINAYGRSKAEVEAIGEQVFRSTGLSVYLVRPFNVIGPGQSADFFVPTVARQIARIEAGLQEPELHLGDLSGARDFVDARDVADGLLRIAMQGKVGEVYNLCSGVATPTAAVVECLRKKATRELRIVSAPASNAQTIRSQRGSPEKTFAATRWKAMIPLETTLGDVLEQWRQSAQSETD
jgi:nucleoside-diphosphate-sugar epimerase